MNFRDKIEEYAIDWEVDLPTNWLWPDLLPLLEKVVRSKGGYFVIKVDGERTSNRISFALNIPFPTDVVLRKDTDEYEDGIVFIIQELWANKVGKG